MTTSDERTPKGLDKMPEVIEEVHRYAHAEARRQLRAGGGELTASDLAQSVVREVLETGNRLEYRGPAELRALTRQILAHRIADRLRRRRAARRDSGREVSLPSESATPEALGGAPDPSPSEAAKVGELRDRLQQRLSLMTETERKVLLLRLEGLQHDEISRALGISVANSFKTLSRLRQKLADLIG